MGAQSTLLAVAAIFILVMIGYLCRRAGVLQKSDSRVINTVVIYIAMPAYIFVSTHNRPLTIPMLKAPFVLFASEMVVVGLVVLLGRAMKWDGKLIAAMAVASAFGNTGFVGYPLVHAAFGTDPKAMISAVMLDSFGMANILITVGVAIITTLAHEKFNFRNSLEFLKTPLLWAAIISLLLRKVAMPELVMTVLDYAAKMTVPLAMISIGLCLQARSVSKQPVALGVALFMKLAFLPCLMYIALPWFGVTGVVANVGVLLGATPSAVFSGILSERFGADGEFAASVIFASTLLGIVVIPLVLMAL